MMHYALAFGLVLLNTLWLVLVVLGLPGNWLMVISALLAAWWHGSAAAPNNPPLFHWLTLASIAVLAAIGELLEFLAGVAGSRKAGGTRRGAIGAIVGGLAGGICGTMLIPVPIFGSLLGACGGAGLGAALFELAAGQNMDAATRIGISAGHGRLLGTFYKILVGIAIWLIIAFAAFWP